MTPRRLALAVPVVFLLLSLDRAAPDRPFPAACQSVAGWRADLPAWPGRNIGRLGRAGDPLNMVFVGSPDAVREVLARAGWSAVPTSVRGSLWGGLRELLTGRTLAAFPPMNDYRLVGRLQDMNWSIPISGIEKRHHFRLWRRGVRDFAGRDIWWGSGNYDLSLRWRDLSHRPDPDGDKERDFVVATVSGLPRVERVTLVDVPQVPRQGFNDKGYPFRNDGRAAVIELR